MRGARARAGAQESGRVQQGYGKATFFEVEQLIIAAFALCFRDTAVQERTAWFQIRF